MESEELLVLAGVGILLYFLLQQKKKDQAQPPGTNPAATTWPGTPGPQSGAGQPPAPVGAGVNQPVCMTDAGDIVPMNADGSCPYGSTLTIAVDVTG